MKPAKAVNGIDTRIHDIPKWKLVVRDRMKELGMTYTDLMEPLGVSTPSAVSHILNLSPRRRGSAEPRGTGIRAEQMAEMCRKLKISMDEVMGLTPHKSTVQRQVELQARENRGEDITMDRSLLEKCHLAAEKWGPVQRPGASPYEAVCALYELAHMKGMDPQVIVDTWEAANHIQRLVTGNEGHVNHKKHPQPKAA